MNSESRMAVSKTGLDPRSARILRALRISGDSSWVPSWQPNRPKLHKAPKMRALPVALGGMRLCLVRGIQPQSAWPARAG